MVDARLHPADVVAHDEEDVRPLAGLLCRLLRWRGLPLGWCRGGARLLRDNRPRQRGAAERGQRADAPAPENGLGTHVFAPVCCKRMNIACRSANGCAQSGASVAPRAAARSHLQAGGPRGPRKDREMLTCLMCVCRTAPTAR